MFYLVLRCRRIARTDLYPRSICQSHPNIIPFSLFRSVTHAVAAVVFFTCSLTNFEQGPVHQLKPHLLSSNIIHLHIFHIHGIHIYMYIFNIYIENVFLNTISLSHRIPHLLTLPSGRMTSIVRYSYRSFRLAQLLLCVIHIY